MKHAVESYRQSLSSPPFRRAFAFSLAALIFGIIVNFFAGTYATYRASNYVEDIVLSNTPVFQVDDLFVLGTFVLVAFVAALAFARPHWVPFTAASLGVFYTVRAIFISLTHLGPFPDRVQLDWGSVVTSFIGGNDLFFSGHTGAPFLLALIFWRERLLRYFFLAWSVFFAVIVLLGHVHYSIDVLSAYFITYTIFHICERLFRRYREYFWGRV
ncbi:MAG: hypothetical protein HYS26_00215 [Candidatus Kaiserbacteria bacterium]|nr:MAG: hypothetical protein HYS26_00215 [Candidatus Kaiserbacteria bacterium]